jgi:hypothetical protein
MAASWCVAPDDMAVPSIVDRLLLDPLVEPWAQAWYWWLAIAKPHGLEHAVTDACSVEAGCRLCLQPRARSQAPLLSICRVWRPLGRTWRC